MEKLFINYLYLTFGNLFHCYLTIYWYMLGIFIMAKQSNLDIAIICSGISGICAAYLLQKRHKVTLSEYAEQKGLHHEVIDQFIIPMAAAIWSGSDFQISRFPIRTFAQFYKNHGLLGVTGHPPWYFVKGGSHSYVNGFLKSFKGRVVKTKSPGPM